MLHETRRNVAAKPPGEVVTLTIRKDAPRLHQHALRILLEKLAEEFGFIAVFFIEDTQTQVLIKI